MKTILQKIIYALVFCLFLPIVLWQWASRADYAITLAVPDVAWVGVVAAIAGAALMAWAMANLWQRGHGLPMNAFPPEHYVFSGAYTICKHPIYVGAVLLCFGVSWATGSAAGVWLVTPLFILMILAYVYGFEREIIAQHFGAKPLLHKTLTDLPANSDMPPSWAEKWRIALLVFVPFLLLYQTFVWVGTPSDVWYSNGAVDNVLPLLPFTVLIYSVSYPLTAAIPFMQPSRRRLRAFAVDAFIGMSLIFYAYLIIPAAVDYPDVLGDDVFSQMIEWGRNWDTPLAALPSFHVFWAMMSAHYLRDVGRWGRVFQAASYLIILSCLSTKNHTLIDVVAAMAVFYVVRNKLFVYRTLLRICEKIGNSWQEWRFGKIRVINHGFYAAVGGFWGFVLMAYLLPNDMWAVYLIGLMGFIGAGLWAQWVEGSSQLLRPFGYYGSVVGVLLALVVAAMFGADVWAILAATAIAACPIQLFGRCRCLIQGCCHGKPYDGLGLSFVHPKSRVNKLAGWRGKNLYPTQFYSIAANFLSFFVLWRLFTLGAPATLLAGVYFVLSGAFRFVEESLRGEPQTPYWLGMRVYQWLAMASVLLGIGLMCVESAPLIAGSLNGAIWAQAAVYFCLIWFVYGVDFPESSRRFSRLTQE